LSRDEGQNAIKSIGQQHPLHLSIKTDPDCPTLAPLSAAEIAHDVDADVFPLLKAIMLVDTDGWNLFNQAEQQRQRQQTAAAFERIAGRLQ
jgi:hypothetical protein